MTTEQKFMQSWTPDLKNENGEFYSSDRVAIMLFEYTQQQAKNLKETTGTPETEQFYCADWNRCGTTCEDQCDACKKANER
jgi:hypothetical protein